MEMRASDEFFCVHLSWLLRQSLVEVCQAYIATYQNVRTVLKRQLASTIYVNPDRKVCKFIGEPELTASLGGLPLELVLLTLARIYDEAHIRLCQTISFAKLGKPYNEAFEDNPTIDVRPLASLLNQDSKAIEGEIALREDPQQKHTLRAQWQPLPPMSFEHLPILQSLEIRLPGEKSSSSKYAGIGGGGGSDIISASLLGHLLRSHEKEMDLLISTRSSVTGSQGKKGSKLGVKREVFNHDGPAFTQNKPVPGTYLVKSETYTEGRDLETIPLEHHKQIYIVLDQTELTAETPDEEKTDLTAQFRAVLSQQEIDTVIVVDTGGDVFGSGAKGHTTPDQDLRVQQAIAKLSQEYNLITAVLAIGVDAPEDAPEKAFKAAGVLYKPTEKEKSMLLDLIARQYRMDGSDPSRYGKTTLALQARLQGHMGWTSLDLPEHVVFTWENPWSSFVYIRECMSDIILMPLTNLLPLIDQGNRT